MRLIPFERVVSDDRKIDNLADILVTEEGPGILNWLIEGARRYLAGDKDLTGPERVRIATTAYAETEDHTGRFFEECTVLHRRGPRRSRHSSTPPIRRGARMRERSPMSRRAFAARIRELVGLASPEGHGAVQPAEVLPGDRADHLHMSDGDPLPQTPRQQRRPTCRPRRRDLPTPQGTSNGSTGSGTAWPTHPIRHAPMCAFAAPVDQQGLPP